MAGPEYIVSACLAGRPCRYDGGSKPCREIMDLVEWGMAVPVCPESLSGLPVPRPPAEQQPDGRTRNRNGVDVTEAFERGALRALAIARASGCRKAVLKAKSPSCGVGHIYDGTFTGALRVGNGIYANMLMEAGFTVMDEMQYLGQLGQCPL